MLCAAARVVVWNLVDALLCELLTAHECRLPIGVHGLGTYVPVHGYGISACF